MRRSSVATWASWPSNPEEPNLHSNSINDHARQTKPQHSSSVTDTDQLCSWIIPGSENGRIPHAVCATLVFSVGLSVCVCACVPACLCVCLTVCVCVCVCVCAPSPLTGRFTRNFHPTLSLHQQNAMFCLEATVTCRDPYTNSSTVQADHSSKHS